MTVDPDFLEHFGVKGMKWGQQKAPMTRGEKFKRGAKIAGGVAVVAGAAFIAYKLNKSRSGSIPISKLTNSPQTKFGQTNAARLMNSKAMQQPVSGLKKATPVIPPKVIPKVVPKAAPSISKVTPKVAPSIPKAAPRVIPKAAPSPTSDQMAKFLRDQQMMSQRINSQMSGDRAATNSIINNTNKTLRRRGR